VISIIIPTLNRAPVLAIAIKAFVAQNFPSDKFEILVVDNDSTDNTKQIVATAIAHYPSHQIQYIYEPEPGLLSGRHRGTLEAKGDILIFVDDDIEANVNWLRAIEESFNDNSVQIVGGRNLPNYEVEPPKWLEWFWQEHPYGQTCAQLSLLDFGEQVREIDANYVWGLNFSIRKKALFDLRGFHPDSIPKHLQYFQGDGETGLTLKANQLGYKAIYQPKALVFHQVPKERMTYKYFDKRSFFQGVCNSYTDIRMKGGVKSTSLKGKVKNLLKRFKQKVLTKSSILSEKEMLEKRFFTAFTEGYQFHQNAVSQNPELLNWILKPDYWDYKLPKIRIFL